MARPYWRFYSPYILAKLAIMDEAATTRVREIKIARGMTSADLSRESGIIPSTLSKIELGQRGLTKQNATLLARALKVPVAELYAEPGQPIPSAGGTTRSDEAEQGVPFRPIPQSAVHYGLPMDIPVYGTAAGSASDGAFVISSGDIVDMAPRGPGIQHLRNVYALYVEGVSMEPWKRPGQIVYIDPVRKPRKGDRVVLVIRCPHAAYDQAFLKEFVKQDDHEVVVKQYNPEKTLQWNADKIISIHRVLEPEEML